ncbi:MAG: hypothetical protein AMXMBFR84_44300 [Candidatus Hydrogenedentota bacterium]
MYMTLALVTAVATVAAPVFESEMVFDPAVESHGHVHASCIVECPNGDLRVVWYENGPDLPAPYYAENRDKADNVRIGGSRKPNGGTWEKPFVMADTFGVSDNNPCMAVDKDNRLWLIYPTLTGVPDWTWGSSILRYQTSTNYTDTSVPVWASANVLIPHVPGIEDVTKSTIDRMAREGGLSDQQRARFEAGIAEALKNPLSRRFGWMPRAHPITLKDGRLLLPLSNENFNVAVMGFTKDAGATWTFSNPVPEAGLTQPTVVERPDGTLVAFFRNSSNRIKKSESTDGGMTWGEVTQTGLLHPGAGIEAVQLKNGNIVMVYNDVEESPRDQLAVSLSTDGGQNWSHTRHIEQVPDQRFDYPSILQSIDGMIHVTYSYNLETIKYVTFNEEWVTMADK